MLLTILNGRFGKGRAALLDDFQVGIGVNVKVLAPMVSLHNS